MEHDNFNSHARVGRDEYKSITVFTRCNFNSHARVGRDGMIWLLFGNEMDFNSHARVGRDLFSFPFSTMEFLFQLTRPCRA